jgi:hypothetical protein
MTNLADTELFGGAIKVSLPQGFLDASYVIGRQSKPGAVPIHLDIA